MATTSTPLLDLPRLTGIRVDGDPGDWGERGFEVGILLPAQGPIHAAGDFDAGFRLGWDERGLLALVRVSAPTWSESPDGMPLYEMDSVQFFVAVAGRGRYEVTVAPGMDPAHPHPRFAVHDARRGDRLPALSYRLHRRATEGGCLLEALLPWANFGADIPIGSELGFLLIANHAEAGGRRYSPRWSSPGWKDGRGLRLADRAAPAENLIVGAGRYDRFRSTLIQIHAVERFAGKTVALRDPHGLQGQAALAPDGPRAAAQLVLPMPPPGAAGDHLDVLLEGQPAARMRLPDADEQRARLLLEANVRFRECVFDRPEFPPCDLEDPPLLAAALGPYTVRVTWFDRTHAAVTAAVLPGRYGAVVEIVPANGPVVRRYQTLYRAPQLPHDLGIPTAVIARQSAQAAALVDSGAGGRWRRDAAAAMTLAGLSETAPDEPAQDAAGNALARDRQWWVEQKRRVLGMDRLFPEPVAAPVRMKSGSATVLRPGADAEAGVRPEAVERVDALCRAWAADSDEAFGVCLARRGIVFLHRAYGRRDGAPLTVEDRSDVASITKIYAGLLMMMLVDQGRVDLADPVERFFPGWRGAGGGPAITIRHLFTHTAGIPGSVFLSDELHDAEERLAAYRPFLAVGDHFEYGNTGYTLAGKIIELVSGESIPQFYRRHLLDPLGCTRTEAQHLGHGIRAVPLEVARVGQLLVNRGAYGEHRFLSEAAVGRMLPQPLTDLLGPSAPDRWGIGLRAYRIDGLSDQVVGHNASSSSLFRADLVRGLVVVMTRNRPGRNFDKYHDRFLKTVVATLAD